MRSRESAVSVPKKRRDYNRFLCEEILSGSAEFDTIYYLSIVSSLCVVTSDCGDEVFDGNGSSV